MLCCALQELKLRQTELQRKLTRSRNRIADLKSERRRLRDAKQNARASMKTHSAALKSAHSQLTVAQKERYSEEQKCGEAESWHDKNVQKVNDSHLHGTRFKTDLTLML